MQPAGTSDFEGFDKLKEINVRILETAVKAVERVSSNLRFWTLQTGGKVCHLWLVMILDLYLHILTVFFSVVRLCACSSAGISQGSSERI